MLCTCIDIIYTIAYVFILLTLIVRPKVNQIKAISQIPILKKVSYTHVYFILY